MGGDTGAAYLFDGSTGTLLKTFLNPTPAAGDLFGAAVAAAGDNILVGLQGTTLVPSTPGRLICSPTKFSGQRTTPSWPGQSTRPTAT